MSYAGIHRVFVVFLVSIMMVFSPAIAQNADREATNEDAILILDASGSMWGQIEGKAKIEIARGVLDELLDNMPTSTRLGLMAYGHSKKGDCSDIELLSELGANRADIKRAVKSISPKGKTPISASVKLAAETLKYTENKATVILISDGIETCNLDPCELGKQLEKDGVDFTAHVVGFDIVDKNTEAQLQCLASSTGGLYLSAANAGELSLALNTTIKTQQVGAPPATINLEATVLENGPVIEAGLNWQVQQAGGGEIVYASENKGAVSREIPPGVYDVFVTRPSDGLKGTSRLVNIPPGSQTPVTIALDPQFAASVTPDREQVAAGQGFSVIWTGPDKKADFITITRPDTPARGYTSYAYTNNGNPLKLTAPINTGSYEVRYVLSRPYKVLARTPMEVTQSVASVKGPDTATAGSAVSIQWSGPASQSDFITVTAVDAKPSAYLNYFYTKDKTTPQNLTMPVTPGDYEIRYVFVGPGTDTSGNAHKIIARQPVVIMAAAASLDGPEAAKTGETLSIVWTGPGGAGDFITITKPDAAQKTYNDYKYASNGSPSKIRMPLTPGAYELRYVQKGGRQGDKVIARKPIEITQVDASLKGPKTASVGAELKVDWTGPRDEPGDFITVTAPDARDSKYLDYAYTKNGSPAKISMPLEPGVYELRYVQNGNKVIARQSISITDISISLTAPAQAKSGEMLSVGFAGPAVRGDWITVVPPDARASKYTDYFYAVNGSPQDLTMPEMPGDYEIRYVLGGKRIVARKFIKIGN
ncbi:MAG: hypothetical protein COA91_07835 [Robiginitomaculum sp.]|nr:MAG: hypothetical protein COA91_07835 [Robiginitomaculum sp.]